jgi:shikimate kinase
MNIFLVGFMGSGKSTAAAELSRISGWPYTDMDHELQRLHNTSITTMFACLGEEWFRKAERELLENVCKLNDRIVATGGGTPCFSDNMDLINRSGVSVYLKCSPEELFLWLRDHKAGRPLISNKTDEELLQYIIEQLAIREPYYLKAHITVNAYTTDPEALWDMIKLLQRP